MPLLAQSPNRVTPKSSTNHRGSALKVFGTLMDVNLINNGSVNQKPDP